MAILFGNGYAPDEECKAPAGRRHSNLRANGERFLHYVQLVLGLAVSGLYTQDLNGQRAQSSGKWVYAVTIGYIASATAAVYLVLAWWWKKHSSPLIAERTTFNLPLFVWELLLIILWLVVFGVFGAIYIGTDLDKTTSMDKNMVVRMRSAVWVDFANLLLWVLTGVWKGLRWWKGRRSGIARTEV